MTDPIREPIASSPATLLLIEDDPQIRRFLQATLASQGFRLVEAPTGAAGLAEAASHPPELVILDLGLPDMDGLEVIQKLREWTRIPILILSARGREQDKIEALDAGADDYVSKPFGIGELLARVRVALRHVAWGGGEGEESRFAVGELSVDLARRSVTVAGRAVHLTPIEYRLLAVLVRHPGRIVTHRQLLGEVWGPQHIEQAHYLRVYAGQLRRKLEQDPARPRYLLTEPGVGYRLAAE